MSNASSPTRYSSDHIYDPNFTQEINSKMRVPKRIKVDGNNEDDMAANYPQWNGGSDLSSKMSMPKRIDIDGNSESEAPLGFMSQWPDITGGVNDKVEMHIPDRIVLIGQEQTYGTTAPPREIVLENQVLPQDPGYIRVQTPPRVITLDQNYRDDYNRQDNLDTDDEFLEVHQPSGLVTPSRGPVPTSNHIAPLNNSLLDSPLPVNGTVRDEMTHLRSLMGKQNKRIVRLEYEVEERRKRDKILFMLTASYLILKTLIWWAKD